MAAARAQIESGPKAPAVFPHEQEGYEPPEPDPEAMREIQRRVDAIPPIDDDKAWGSESWVSSALEVAEPVLIHMPGVKELPVEWLWERRIPRAAVVILDGHPGTGKSTIALDLAAHVSKGQRMPDGARGISGNTLIMSAEDTLERPIKARLEAAGADMAHIWGLDGVITRDNPFGRPLTFPEDNAVLHRSILNVGADLAIIDPISAFVSATINTGIDADVRRAISPLARTAGETGATILLVRHLRKPDRKAPSKPSMMDGGGSLGGFGGARSILQAVMDEEDTTQRALWHVKSNYGPLARVLDYAIERVEGSYVGRIAWMP